jgi:hypothetical protein
MKIAAIRSSALVAFALAAGCGSGAQVTPPVDGGSSSGGGSSGASGGSSGSSGGQSGSSGGGSSSSSSGSGSGGSEADATTAGDGAPAEASAEASGPGGARQVLVWTPTYLNFAQSLHSVTTTTPKAFTEVSPDFYRMNVSGTPSIQGATFDGLTIAQVAMQVHGAGMKLLPLMYGPSDQDTQTFLNDSGAQSTLLTWLVMEAQTNGYDGWNLDWEPSSVPYPRYGAQYVSFLTMARAALNAKNLILTVDLGGWYIQQCGHDGGIDLTQIGPAVDVAIIEDYAGGLGPPNPLNACPGGPAGAVNCAPDPNNYFGTQLNLMCDVSPAGAVGIGLINGQGGTGANPFLPMALDSIATIGFTQVAVWPDESTFLTSTNIPGGATWYSLLAQFLAQ